jgi:hypothetical protein
MGQGPRNSFMRQDSQQFWASKLHRPHLEGIPMLLIPEVPPIRQPLDDLSVPSGHKVKPIGGCEWPCSWSSSLTQMSLHMHYIVQSLAPTSPRTDWRTARCEEQNWGFRANLALSFPEPRLGQDTPVICHVGFLICVRGNKMPACQSIAWGEKYTCLYDSCKVEKGSGLSSPSPFHDQHWIIDCHPALGLGFSLRFF